MRISDLSSDVCSSDLADRETAATGFVDELPGLVPDGVFEGRAAGLRAQRLRGFAARRDAVHFGLDRLGFAGAAAEGGAGHHRAFGQFAMAIGIAEVGERQRAAFARAKHDIATDQDILDLAAIRSEEHTSELQSLMRISYAVFCLKKKT